MPTPGLHKNTWAPSMGSTRGASWVDDLSPRGPMRRKGLLLAGLVQQGNGAPGGGGVRPWRLRAEAGAVEFLVLS